MMAASRLTEMVRAVVIFTIVSQRWPFIGQHMWMYLKDFRSKRMMFFSSLTPQVDSAGSSIIFDGAASSLKITFRSISPAVDHLQWQFWYQKYSGTLDLSFKTQIPLTQQRQHTKSAKKLGCCSMLMRPVVNPCKEWSSIPTFSPIWCVAVAVWAGFVF